MERLRVSHIFHTFLYRCRTAGRVPADMVIGLLWIAALGSCLVCDGGRLACQPPGVPAAFMHKLPAKHLPNAYRLHEKVISGGQPEGAEAFAELRALGVKTIVSVDGAKPDVELARTYGLRYVHLPIGYNGVPAERASWPKPCAICKGRSTSIAIMANIAGRQRRRWPASVRDFCRLGMLCKSCGSLALVPRIRGFIEPPSRRALWTLENWTGFR